MKTLYDCLEEGEDLINSDSKNSDSEKIFSLYQQAMFLTYDPVESIAMLDHFIEFIDKCHLDINIKSDACKYSKFLLEKLSKNYLPYIFSEDLFVRYNILHDMMNPPDITHINVKIKPFSKFLNNYLRIKQLYDYGGDRVKPQTLGVILNDEIRDRLILISENNRKEKQILKPHIDSLLKGYMPDFYE